MWISILVLPRKLFPPSRGGVDHAELPPTNAIAQQEAVAVIQDRVVSGSIMPQEGEATIDRRLRRGAGKEVRAPMVDVVEV
jgi:hypothetical protein